MSDCELKSFRRDNVVPSGRWALHGSRSPSSGRAETRQSRSLGTLVCSKSPRVTSVPAVSAQGFIGTAEPQHKTLLHPFPKDAPPALSSRPRDCQLVIPLCLVGLLSGLYLFLKCWSPTNTKGFLGRKNKPQRNPRAILSAQQSCLFLGMMLAETVKVTSL